MGFDRWLENVEALRRRRRKSHTVCGNEIPIRVVKYILLEFCVNLEIMMLIV